MSLEREHQASLYSVEVLVVLVLVTIKVAVSVVKHYLNELVE